MVSHLVFEHRYGEAVVACRRIRSFSRRSQGLRARRELHLTWEIGALLALRKPGAAWLQYRLLLRQYPKHVRLKTIEERVRNAPRAVRFKEVPILYAAGRWKDGADALEAYLGAALSNKRVIAYDLLFTVYNEDLPEPRNRCRVTLSHLYSKLGRRLDQWKDWRRWVDALHPILFQLSGVDRSALVTNADALPVFYERLMKERESRSGGSGAGFGQRDLVESRGKVEKRHERNRQMQESWERRRLPLRDELNAKLPKYFPFITSE